MCCCDVKVCCCGCSTMKMGVIIWAFIDAGLNFFLFIFTVVPLLGLSPTYYCLNMVLWDIMLALGAHFEKLVLIILWQIFMMIYIVALFCMWWIAIAALFGYAALMGSYNLGYARAAFAVYAGILIICLFLPFVYIYFWIVVNGLRIDLVNKHFGPMYQQQPQGTNLVQTYNTAPIQNYHSAPNQNSLASPGPQYPKAKHEKYPETPVPTAPDETSDYHSLDISESEDIEKY